MATQTQTQIESIGNVPEKPPWSLATRVAFRLVFLYFGIYCLLTQILFGLFPIPGLDFFDPGALAPVRGTVFWTASHIFHTKLPLVYQGSGSGDKTYDWVMSFCTLVVAVLGTAAWSALDRRRRGHPGLYKWFYLVLRFALASEMFLYGMVKVVPLQMQFPNLAKLVEPFGDFSPMGVLWWSIGASPGYERFVGSMELVAGILLIVPRTTMLGALVCLADSIEIFTLNMTYDVPVKLFSFHLILMSLVLLAPELPRLMRFFLTDSPVGPSRRLDLFRSARTNRVATAVQLIFGLALLGMNGYGASKSWRQFGGGAPKSRLYGIWNVEEYVKDGTAQPALLDDLKRPRRVLFDRPQAMLLQLMNNSFVTYGSNINGSGDIGLTKFNDKNWKANLKYTRSGNDRLRLEGSMDGHAIRMELARMDVSKMMLVSRGFHWVQEYPYNR